MYHGTNGTIEDINATTDICLTSDEMIAGCYGINVYEIRVAKGAQIACEDAIRETFEAYHGRTEDYVFEMADCAITRANLAADGFAGCEYADLSPDNMNTHDTLRIWDASVLTLVGRA